MLCLDSFLLISHLLFFFLYKQKTAYELRISDWSSDVCSSDLRGRQLGSVRRGGHRRGQLPASREQRHFPERSESGQLHDPQPDHPDRSRPGDRKSVVSGKSVSVRVDLGGRRIIKNKKINTTQLQTI